MVGDGEEVLRNPNRASKGIYALNSSSSSSSSSSSYLSLSPASENGGEFGLDGVELEAARALACISRMATRESGGRRLKRFKSRSPVSDWEISNQGWDLTSVPEKHALLPSKEDADAGSSPDKQKVVEEDPIAPRKKRKHGKKVLAETSEETELPASSWLPSNMVLIPTQPLGTPSDPEDDISLASFLDSSRPPADQPGPSTCSMSVSDMEKGIVRMDHESNTMLVDRKIDYMATDEINQMALRLGNAVSSSKLRGIHRKLAPKQMAMDNEAIRVTVEEKAKSEQISEILPLSSNCSTNSISCSRHKARLNPTEVEREARRMRRVLANRESARQTILRRQAIRDGLTKKVSDLSLVNQNMKLEKVQITKEYMSLRNKNKELQNELAMAMAYNIMGAEAASPPLEASSSPSENSFLVNIKPPFMPSICPPWPVIASHSGLCYNHYGSLKATEPRTPSSCFLSLFDQMSVSQSFKWKEKEKADILAVEKPSMQEKNQRENSMKADKSRKLDIDLNCRSIGDEPVRAFDEQSAKFLDASTARRRRKEILKLKHVWQTNLLT